MLPAESAGLAANALVASSGQWILILECSGGWIVERGRFYLEKKQPPQEIIATKFEGPDARHGKGAVLFQRPLCLWPKVATYKGGPTEKAESFQCE